MRCISPIAGYSIQAFEGEEDPVIDARGHSRTVVTRKPVVCNFHTTGLLDHEIEIALEQFNFTGLPEGVHPLTRVGVFDTEMYAEANFKKEARAEKLKELDDRLRELSLVYPSEFRCVDMPAAEKPWDNYDDGTTEEVISLQKATGISPEKIRLYEGENQNREEIIEAMWRLQDPDYADEHYGPASDEVAEVSA